MGGGITSKHGEALLLSDDGNKKSRNAVLSKKIVTHLKHKRNTFIYYFGTVYNANVSIGVYPIPTLYTPLLPHCPWTYSVYPWICNLEILECALDVSPDLMRTFWLRRLLIWHIFTKMKKSLCTYLQYLHYQRIFLGIITIKLSIFIECS